MTDLAVFEKPKIIPSSDAKISHGDAFIRPIFTVLGEKPLKFTK